MGLKRVSAAVLLSACLFPVALLAQVHMERGKDGTILITDQTRGNLYAAAGSALTWRRESHRIEVLDTTSQKWVPAPGDYPQVIAGGNLLLAFGTGNQGSAVYDAARGGWGMPFEGFVMGYLSENLAVGRISRGEVAIYDTRVGSWQKRDISCDTIQVADELAVFFGEGSDTDVYDGRQGAWHHDRSPFANCTLGNRLALFWGPPSTDSLIYDAGRGAFVKLRERLQSADVYADLAAGLGAGKKGFAYSSPDGTWISFRGNANSVRVANGQVLLSEDGGDEWIFEPGQERFVKVKPETSNP
jgi:hypothetical protein